MLCEDMKPPRRKLVIVLSLAFAGVIALFVWKSIPPAEPIYHGKLLHVWLEEWRANAYPTTNWSTRSDQAKQEAADAVRVIGTDALPFLLESLHTKESPLKWRLGKAVPVRWHRVLHLNYGPYDSQFPGIDGFYLLGALGAPALPELRNLAEDGDLNHLRWGIGALGSLGSAGEPAIPFLIQCLTNTDWQTRQMAAWSLCAIKKQPDLAIPALIQYLKFLKTLSLTAEDVYCVDYLSVWGTNAKPAVPLILELLESTNADKRLAATNSLPRIDPEAAERAHLLRQK